MDKQIKIIPTDSPKEKPDPNTLEFGRSFTDHMFILDYSEKDGWHDARIIPYAPLSLDPASIALHYGQTVFEGMKAYYTESGDINLFRPKMNIQRLNRSSSRLCIPALDEEFAVQAIKELVAYEKDWIPKAEGTSLYIRPFIIATEAFLGVASSTEYQFIVILSPVGAYYKEGINPVKIAVEDTYVRAVKGGTGEAKTGGNYASALKAQEVVNKEGFSQVLWLDGVEKKYIEEVGSMNVFFKIKGEVVTPELRGSILPGVTRDSVIKLLKHWDIPLVERKISMQELADAHENGLLEEAFGTGTAAVISPIGQLTWDGKDMIINHNKTGDLSSRIYNEITQLQYGKVKDPFDWIVKVN